MFQKGWKFGGTITIDDLNYNYQPNSNKLNYVRDGSNDANSILGDFTAQTQNNSDITVTGKGVWANPKFKK